MCNLCAQEIFLKFKIYWNELVHPIHLHTHIHPTSISCQIYLFSINLITSFHSIKANIHPKSTLNRHIKTSFAKHQNPKIQRLIVNLITSPTLTDDFFRQFCSSIKTAMLMAKMQGGWRVIFNKVLDTDLSSPHPPWPHIRLAAPGRRELARGKEQIHRRECKIMHLAQFCTKGSFFALSWLK